MGRWSVPSLVPPVAPLGLASNILVAAVLGYLVLVAPVRGRRTYRRLRANPDLGPTRRMRVYRLGVLLQGGFAAVTVAILVISPTLHADQVGLAWPRGPQVPTAVVVAAVFVVMSVVSLLWLPRSPQRVRTGAFWAILPRTATERWWTAALSVAAGISEELLFRGLLIAAGVSVGLSIEAALWWSAVLFALPHMYLGWGNVVFTWILGWVLAGLYVTTGSLLTPTVVHLAIDLRGLVVVPFLWRRSLDSDGTPAAAPALNATPAEPRDATA